MKKTRIAYVIAIVSMLALPLPAANTIQNFVAEFPDIGPIPAPDILTEINGSNPGPVVVDGWDGQALRLTHDGVNSQNNSVAFNQLIPGGYESLDITLDIQVTGEGGHADGYGFGLLNTANHGKTTATRTPDWQPEEPNIAGSFGVGFDTFANEGLDPTGGGDLPNSVSLHYDGAVVDQLLTSEMEDQFGDLLLEDWLQSGSPITLNVGIQPVAGGSNVTVTMIDQDSEQVVVPFENVKIDGFDPYEARMAFRGRTGGANSNQEIDNIAYRLNGGASVVVDDFESYEVDEPIPNNLPDLNPTLIGGTPYAVSVFGNPPGPIVANDAGASGVVDGHMQLTEEIGSNNNFIAFDKTSDNSDRIEASFKIRVNDSGNNADGFGVGFLPTSDNGDSGPMEAAWGPAEEPNITGGIGLGFDTFDNDEEGLIDETGCGQGGLCEDRRANHISLHSDGANVSFLDDGEGFIDRDEFDLVNDEWNDVLFVIEKTDDGDTAVTVVVTDGTDGSTHLIYDAFKVPGQFDGPVRFAAGARTGGAFSFQGIDDINIDYGDGNPCDFDGDGTLGVGDLNALSTEIQSGNNSASFDLTGDGVVDAADLTAFVTGEDKLHTWVGDANLDGEFNSSDFVSVFQEGLFETGQAATWSQGDWNGDGVFSSSDFVSAFQDGGFELGPRWQGVAAVPEPSSLVLLALGCLGLVSRSRRRS